MSTTYRITRAIAALLSATLVSGCAAEVAAAKRAAAIDRGAPETLPLTHYLRIVRGIVLRDVDTTFVLEELVPIGIFAACATGASLLVWRRTIA